MCFRDCLGRRVPVQPASGVSHSQSSSKTRRRRRRRRGGSQNCRCCHQCHQTIWCHMYPSCAPNTHGRQDVKHMETLGNTQLTRLPSASSHLCSSARELSSAHKEQNSDLAIDPPLPLLLIPHPPISSRHPLPPHKQTRTCPL